MRAALYATMSPDDPNLSLLACAERPSGRPAPPRHPGEVPRSESRLEPGGNRHDGGASRRPLGRDVGASPHILLVVSRPRLAGRGVFGAGISHPARLRPRRLLPHPRHQRLGRPRIRRPDDDALRLLEADARRPSRLLGQSRPSRHRRHRHVDGARIPGSRLAKSAPLPAVPASNSHVWTGPHLYVPIATSRSGRPDARRRVDAVGIDHVDQCGHRRHCRLADVAYRSAAFSDDSRTHLPARRVDGSVAVLRSAPVRGYALDAGGKLDVAGRRVAWVFALRSARRLALVQRQHRRTSRPSPCQPRSLLPSARSAARLSRTPERRQADAGAKPALRELHALGRGIATADLVPETETASEAAKGRGARVSNEVAPAMTSGDAADLSRPRGTPPRDILADRLSWRCVSPRRSRTGRLSSIGRSRSTRRL